MVIIITYQNFLKNKDNLKAFIVDAIDKHKRSPKYKTAVEAEQYMRRQNVTIKKYQKILYSANGTAYADSFSPNYKLYSGFFPRLINQQVQFLLKNGVIITEKEKLGLKFNTSMQTIARDALVQGVAYGFWNLDHLEIFNLTEFIPLIDVKDGSIKAGIRFWQFDKDSPLRITIFEIDGYTDYLIEKETLKILNKKRAYKITTIKNAEKVIYKEENYKSFPIIPLYGNQEKQSELIGLREQIDCYDLVKSGFANDVDSEQVYWLLKNAGGMDPKDLQRFRDQIKTVKAVVAPSEVDVSAHTISIPYEARETYLKILEDGIYNDFQGFNVTKLNAGNRTATEIKAAYESINAKTNVFEQCVKEFLYEIFEIIGIDEEPFFVRNMMVNETEAIDNLLKLKGLVPDNILINKIGLLTDKEKEDAINELLERGSSNDNRDEHEKKVE